MTKYKNISYLLKELSIISMKYEILYEQKEKFNIFSVLHKDHDERRLHSRFIAALLNPEGTHKKGNIFLSLFLNVIDVELQDITKVKVYPEELDKKEYNNIDILILNKKKEAIIIENKIYAGDSNSDKDGQLERYYNRVKNEDKVPEKEITTLYLTLDGHDPSDESIGTDKTLEDINGQCVSYDNHIIDWLNQCLKEVTNSPFLRESILQYKSLLEKMTGNQTDTEHRLAIRDTIAKSEESMKAAKELIDNFKHVKWHTVRNFWDELSNEIKRLGYEITMTPNNKEVTDITHYEAYRKGQKDKQACGIFFKVDEGLIVNIYHWADYPLHLSCDKEDVNDKYKKAIATLLQRGNTYEKDESCLIFKTLFSKEENKIWLNNFELDGTFNLIDEAYRKKAITEICNEIKQFVKDLK